jgi:hypothetical protein
MILLGYRDRNVHELVCHEVAVRAGLYSRFGVEVEAVPTAEHPEAPLSAGLGGSLVETLRGQREWRGALVHTLHPLFWLWGRSDGLPLSDVRRVAGHPDGSIVWAFTEALLGARDVRMVTLETDRFPVGIKGDRQRLEALTSGTVDAAVIGTAYAPSALSRSGLTPLLHFGDGMRFPTTGVAVDVDLIAPDDPTVVAVVAAQREALGLIRSQATVAIDAVAALLPDGSRDDAELLLRDYLAARYGPERHDIDVVGADAVAWLSQMLTADSRPAQNFFEEIR